MQEKEKKPQLSDKYPNGINSESPGAKELGAPKTPTCPHCGALTPIEGLIMDYTDTVIWLSGCIKPCECVGAQKERAEAALKIQQEKEAEQRRLLDMRRTKAGLGKRETLCTLATYQETDGNRLALKTARKYIASHMAKELTGRKINSLYIYGSVGTGKTHLAAAIANELIEYGKPVLYTKFADLCRELKKAYSENRTETEDVILNRYRACPLLIIDDLGKEKASEWSTAILYDIVDYRYRELLPMIITSNFGMEQAAMRLSPTQETDSTATAIVDRFMEAFYAVQVRGTSWRTVQKKPFGG